MVTKPAILVLADAESSIEWITPLERNGFIVRRFVTEREILEAAAGCSQDHLRDSLVGGVIVIRRASPAPKTAEVLRRLMPSVNLPVILVQDRRSPDLAAAARACGVHDYLREPVSIADFAAAIESCACLPRTMTHRLVSGLAGGERMVGTSAAMDEVRSQIAHIAATDCNVLITGDSGTGKELAAELIHRNSSRSKGPFVCINCAAIPEALLESELFGFERGSFTGAQTSRPGQLELADGGVLFLDEIGELSLSAQAKILRVIESKEVQRLGRRSGLKVNIRIVCATNRDLEAEVEAGTFRLDLYFRLKVASLSLPRLTDRREDLPQLAVYYFRELNQRMGLHAENFTEHSWRTLMQHDWPGNVREFRNVIESAMVQIPYPRMRLVELPDEFHRRYAAHLPAEPSESEQLLAALVTHNWNKSKVAAELQWSRMTLYRKMAKYQLSSASNLRARTA